MGSLPPLASYIQGACRLFLPVGGPELAVLPLP